MRALIIIPALLALAGCSGVPTIETGAIACVRVDALTAQTTTVYIAAGVAGTIVVRPDCTVGAQLLPRGAAL
jgi:hypothetical protein